MGTTSQGVSQKFQPGFLRAAIDATVNAGAINASDLVYWTGNGAASFGSGLSLNAALVAQIGKLLGVSNDQSPLRGGIQNPLLDIGIYTAGEIPFGTTAGDTYTHLAPVTIGADAQTITLAPTGPPATGASATGTGGTFSAAAHVLSATFLTALGETTPGASATVTLTAGQEIETPVVTIPAWALGVCWYVDGLFVAYESSGAAVALAGPNASPRVVPVENALAIGFAYMPLTPTANTTSVAGGAGITIGVRLKPIFPQRNGLI
jgi:hypothetical protein